MTEIVTSTKTKQKRLNDKVKNRKRALQCITVRGFTAKCINVRVLYRMKHI